MDYYFNFITYFLMVKYLVFIVIMIIKLVFIKFIIIMKATY